MNKKQKNIRIAILLVVLVFLVYLTIQFFPIFSSLTTEEGRNNFKVVIEGLGLKGFFVILGLMCIQIIIPFFPGEPIELLAGMCFGSINGLLIILLGLFLSSVIIISLVILFGKNFIYTFVKKEKIDKIENSKFLKNKEKLELIIFILFIFPGTPKDILIYIAALLPINTYRFLIISTFARIPSVISSTIAGDSLVNGNFFWCIASYVIVFLITAVLIYLLNKKEKNIIKVVNEIK